MDPKMLNVILTAGGAIAGIGISWGILKARAEGQGEKLEGLIKANDAAHKLMREKLEKKIEETEERLMKEIERNAEKLKEMDQRREVAREQNILDLRALFQELKN